MSHALQTQAAVSPASQAGMGPSATSPALLAPLAITAGSSAPTAGLGRPVSQTLGSVSAVTLAGWGPGVKTPARLAPLGKAVALPACPVPRGPVML